MRRGSAFPRQVFVRLRGVSHDLPGGVVVERGVLALPSFYLAWEFHRRLPEPARGGQSRLERGATVIVGEVDLGEAAPSASRDELIPTEALPTRTTRTTEAAPGGQPT